MTGSSTSGSTSPIQVNTLTSQITRHRDVTLVNSPTGVTMAWEAPVDMDLAGSSQSMGVSNMRHDVTTDSVTGETTSIASTEFTHEEYETYRNSPQGRRRELPPQPPEEPANTQGVITFAPGPSGNRAEYATPPEQPSPEADEDQPNEHLQTLIDEANDERSLWQRAQDGASSAWDSTKRIASASWENPGEFGKGLAKGIGNLPSDLANLAVEGIKSGGGFNPLNLNNYAKLLDYQAVNAYQAGNIATANTMASQANSIREFGQVGDIFEITNDAQQGGSFASIFIPLGTLVKAPAAAAKGMRAAKTVDAVADTTKVADTAADANKASNAADTASDAAKVPEPKGPDGNGTGGNVKPKKPKKPLECGQRGTYGKLNDFDAESVDMERDHIPPQAALIQRARDLAEQNDINLTPQQEKQLEDKIARHAQTVAIPKEVHRQGETNSNPNNKDGAADLQGAARKESGVHRENMRRSDKHHGCLGALQKATGTIGKISNKQYDEFLGKLIDDTASGTKTTNPWKGIL